MISCFKGQFKVTSVRGYRKIFGQTEFHGGLDLVAIGSDKNVYAIADGTVDAVPYEANGFGYYVRQLLPDGRRIYYGHMVKGSIFVKAGQLVKAGQKLGVMGTSGKSTGLHTHLEIRPKGTSKQSLDICEFTGIPNIVGTYEVKPISTTKTEVKKSMDNNAAEWAKEAVDWAIKSGIIKGDENGDLKLHETLTVERFLVFLNRYDQLPFNK